MSTPVTNTLIITSSMLMAKASSMPEAMAGATRGKVTSKNTRTGEAPKSWAASGRLLSMPTSRAFTSMNT